jgi:tetratricopeptide (TPR) repeat protein
MKPVSSFKRRLEKIRRLADQKKHGKAFDEADRLLREWPDNPELLVLWSDLLQLQEEDKGPSLEAAKAALQRAADLDDQAPQPLIELGYYLYALEDDNKGAAKLFDRAISLSRRLLEDALVGKVKALEDLGRGEEAWKYVEEIIWLRRTNGQARDSSPYEVGQAIRTAVLESLGRALQLNTAEELVEKLAAK